MVGAGFVGAVYGRVAARRRRWYACHAAHRRWLDRPVISVGALAVGGSGKTPVAVLVAQTLASLGEHPAILSRGYGRQRRPKGAVVVSQRGALQAGIDVAGDEPFMMARQVADASVVVADDRYLAGRAAEQELGATVHVLDDGYQHLRLNRDVDILVLGRDDLEGRPMPAGRLRESLEAGHTVHAVMVEADGETGSVASADPEPDGDIGNRADHDTGGPKLPTGVVADERFGFSRRLESPQSVSFSPASRSGPDVKALAVCGIARPHGFFEALGRAGYDVVDSMSFADHHVYASRDIERIGTRMAATAATHVLTTEKDAVRFEPHAPLSFPLLWVPLRVVVEPATRFRTFVARSVAAARQKRP